MTKFDGNEKTLAAEEAERFQRQYEWIDALAVETNLEIASTYNSLMAAFARCLTSIGESRATGRSRLLRLLFLSDHKRVSQHELGRQLGVTSANMTYLVDGLEKEELVRRVVNQADRRVTFVKLTNKGDTLCRKLVPLMGQFFATTCGDLTEEEKQQFISLLKKFRCTSDDSFLQRQVPGKATYEVEAFPAGHRSESV